MYLCVKKTCKGCKLLFDLLRVANVKLVNKGRSVSIKRICVDNNWFVFVLAERVSSLNHKEDVLIRRNVEAWVIKVRVANSLCRWSVLTHILTKRMVAFVLYHHLAMCNVEYAGCSKIDRQEI